MIKFEYDRTRALNAYAYIDRYGKIIPREAVILLHLADMIHLEKYHIPICGGTYVCTPDGICSLELFNDLFPTIDMDCENQSNWIKLDPAALSGSNVDVLNELMSEYEDLSFKDIVSLSQEYSAWKKHFKPVPYEDLLEEVNKDLISLIEDQQKAEKAID